MKCIVSAGLVAAALAAVFPAPAQAQKQFGAANVLCSQYAKAARTSDIVYHQASHWLLGYVSGMNAAMASSNAAVVVNLSNDQVLKSALDHCTANPGASIAAAAGRWYAQMPKQAEPPQQAQSQPPSKDDNWIKLNLEAPARKPLLDRR
ncbi:MAG: hypothetical protein K2Z80_37855 [Xanthobacteraceae bacterium]|nr:hypothetical protein [Xanthobacteraceae bacterium]